MYATKPFIVSSLINYYWCVTFQSPKSPKGSDNTKASKRYDGEYNISSNLISAYIQRFGNIWPHPESITKFKRKITDLQYKTIHCTLYPYGYSLQAHLNLLQEKE